MVVGVHVVVEEMEGQELEVFKPVLASAHAAHVTEEHQPNLCEGLTSPCHPTSPHWGTPNGCRAPCSIAQLSFEAASAPESIL